MAKATTTKEYKTPLSNQQIDEIWNAALEIQSLKDALKVSTQEIENTYAFAYLLHQQKKYEVAADTFQTLMMLDPTDWRFPYGFGACQHALQQWSLAAVYFTVAAELDSTNPFPYYYAGDCYQKMGNFEGAKAAYQTALERIEASRDRSQWKPVENQIRLLLKQLPTQQPQAKG